MRVAAYVVLSVLALSRAHAGAPASAPPQLERPFSSFVWQDMGEGTQRTVIARLGDWLQLKWEERRALRPAGWKSSGGRLRLYTLPGWGQGRGGSVVNWNLNGWLDLEQDGRSLLQSLVAAGEPWHASYAMVDLLWAGPGRAATESRLIHARFMRRRADGLLFLRLALPDLGAAPVTLHLTARAYDVCLPRYWENVIHTRTGLHVACCSLDGKETITPWHEAPDANAPAMVCTRRIDAYHGGVGVLYDPQAIAELAAGKPGGDRSEIPLTITLKPGIRVAHLAFWDYRQLGGASALQQLLAMAPIHERTRRDAAWQQTRIEQVLRPGGIRKRARALLAGPALTKEQRATARDLLQHLDALAQQASLNAPSALASAYAKQHALHRWEIAAHAAALKQLESAFRQGRLQPAHAKTQWQNPNALELEE